MKMNRRVLRKVREPSIQGFRGFVKRPEGAEPPRLITDADVVLVTGPNGFGKTSLLQALTLLLAGHPELNPKDLFALDAAPGERAEPARREPARQSIHLEARVDFEERQAPEKPSDEESAARPAPAEPETVTLGLDWRPEQSEQEPAYTCNREPGAHWPRTLASPDRDAESEEPDASGLRKEDDERKQRRARSRELVARVTSFHPERVENLFKSLTTGSTLRDVFYPVPEPVRAALEALGNGATRVEDQRERVARSIKPQDELDEERAKAQNALAERWEPIRGAVTVLADRLARSGGSRGELSALESLKDLERPTLEELGARLGELRTSHVAAGADVGPALVDTLAGVIERELETARQAAREVKDAERLLEEQKRLKDRLARIASDNPRLDEELACFASGPEHQELPGLLAVLRSVAENTDGWLEHVAALVSNQPPHQVPKLERELESIVRELRAVVPGNARKRAQELEQWLRPREMAEAERKKIELRLEEIEEELEGYRQSEDVQRLRTVKRELEADRRSFVRAHGDLHKAQRAIELQGELRKLEAELETFQQEIEDAIEVLEAVTGANEQILNRTAKSAEGILERFSMTPGILPLTVERVAEQASPQRANAEAPHSEIKTASGLALSQLSTGQRAQLSVSLAVAQSELLRAATNVDLPFYVLVLDDASTAYDLSNLTREAIFWRQLAYHEKPERRWQLFIASHHEDMTNHLLDLLVPPHGAALRVVRFVDWSRERGPEIEQFWVEPSAELTPQAREHIKTTFKEELCLAS